MDEHIYDCFRSSYLNFTSPVLFSCRTMHLFIASKKLNDGLRQLGTPLWNGLLSRQILIPSKIPGSPSKKIRIYRSRSFTKSPILINALLNLQLCCQSHGDGFLERNLTISLPVCLVEFRLSLILRDGISNIRV